MIEWKQGPSINVSCEWLPVRRGARETRSPVARCSTCGLCCSLWKQKLNCGKHAIIANNQHHKKGKLRRDQFLTRERMDIDKASRMEKTVDVEIYSTN